MHSCFIKMLQNFKKYIFRDQDLASDWICQNHLLVSVQDLTGSCATRFIVIRVLLYSS